MTELFVDGRIVRWSALEVVGRNALLNHFAKTPSLNGYNFARLLNTQIRMDALRSLRFLLDRLEIEEFTDSDYSALPFAWGEELAYPESDSFSRVLTKLIEWVLETDG